MALEIALNKFDTFIIIENYRVIKNLNKQGNEEGY